MSNEPLSRTAIALGDSATQRISEWCQVLVRLSQNDLRSVTEDSHLGRELRGAAVVAAMAEVERLLRELLIALSDEINRGSIPICELKQSLRPLAANSFFQSIINSPKGESHWTHRGAVTTLDENQEIASLPSRTVKSPQPPLDGRTIRESHFKNIWQILSIPDDPFPSAQASSSLNALSSLRNDIAHGTIPISEVFHPDNSEKSSARLVDHLTEVKRLVDHASLNFSEYGRIRGYLKCG